MFARLCFVHVHIAAGEDCQFTPERAAQDFFGEDLRRFALGNDPALGGVDADHLGVVLDHSRQIVRGHDHGGAKVREIAEHIEELVVGDCVECRRRARRAAGFSADAARARAISARLRWPPESSLI